MMITYNIPFEVNEKQYNAVRSKFSGIVAYTKIGDKFFLKVWLTKFIPFIIATLAEHEDEDFLDWLNSDNVVNTAEGYRTQCTLYAKAFTYAEVRQYFMKNYKS